ncbi:MAG: hypothetical protein LBC02_10965 [Planctomycetaceae bacterium]|nr:hypothetical protein [Planctomycetaceae bacterium]
MGFVICVASGTFGAWNETSIAQYRTLILWNQKSKKSYSKLHRWNQDRRVIDKPKWQVGTNRSDRMELPKVGDNNLEVGDPFAEGSRRLMFTRHQQVCPSYC